VRLARPFFVLCVCTVSTMYGTKALCDTLPYSSDEYFEYDHTVPSRMLTAAKGKEIKFYDILTSKTFDSGGANMTTYGGCFCINLVPQGSGVSERIGRAIRVLRVDMVARPYHWLIHDRQCNGAYPDASFIRNDTFKQAAGQIFFQNPLFMHRFSVVSPVFYRGSHGHINSYQDDITVSSSDRSQRDFSYIYMNLPIILKDTTPTIADVLSNALYVYSADVSIGDENDDVLTRLWFVDD